MPAKRVIILDRVPGNNSYRAVLWADVPAGNQIAYANPSAVSDYENASPTELQAIRNGQVAERPTEYIPPNGSPVLASAQAWLQSAWASFQAEITAQVSWADYGRFWDGSAWQAPTGVPIRAVEQMEGLLPTFTVLTGVSGFAASKFHLVLYNGVSGTTGQSLVVKPRLVAVKPGQAAVTGAVSGTWTLRRRRSPTTPPSGSGGLTPVPHDSAQLLPAGIGCWNAPGTAPAGGTLETFNQFVPQADEQKLTTLDAPTASAVFGDWAGLVVYRQDAIKPARPIVLRAGEALELQQDGQGGTGNCQVLCVFTVG